MSGSSSLILHEAARAAAAGRQQGVYGPNDQINIACIGMGIMGFNNAAISTGLPGVKLVAACDLYDGRLERTREKFGKDVRVTRDYRELLQRRDIDAVIVSTTDHWHDRITIDALNAGKHVYCEKPMVHKLDEGAAVIDAQRKTGKVVQVGSQRVSSVVTQKARELFRSGKIGRLMMVEAWMDRHSANGAWQYSIPLDATPKTIDWDKFQGDAPKKPFDPVRFFRWRNYSDYGTGIAGDLFVHLFSALHAVLDSPGPERIYSTGGLYYWKDGRDAPDLTMGLYDYPETSTHPAFHLQMRVNFADGSERGEGLVFVGTEGVIELGWNSVRLRYNPTKTFPSYGGWDSFDTFSSAQQREFQRWHESTMGIEMVPPEEEDVVFNAPNGYSANVDHHKNFYDGIRLGKPVVEGALFGMQAAGPALASNLSLAERRIVSWDPQRAVLR